MTSRKRKRNDQHWNEDEYSLLSTEDASSVPVYFRNDTSSVSEEEFSYLLELLTFMDRSLPGKSFMWLEYIDSSGFTVMDLYQKKTVVKESSSKTFPAVLSYVIYRLGSYEQLSERYRHVDRKRERSTKRELAEIIKELDEKKEQIERKNVVNKHEQSLKPIRPLLKRKRRGDSRENKKVDFQLQRSSINFFESESIPTNAVDDSSKEVDILDVPQYYGDVSIEIDGYSLLN